MPIPDARLLKLAELYHPEKITPASVKFVDIAGLVAGASRGEGLGNQFLAHIREADAIAMVIRSFSAGDVVHVAHSIDPKRDIEIIQTELALADLQTLEKRLPILEKEAKANPKLRPDYDLFCRVHDALENGIIPAAKIDNTSIDIPSLKHLNLLTIKPLIFVFNVDETDLTDSGRQAELSKLIAPNQALFINAKMEAELKDMPQAEQEELLESVGIDEPGLHKLIHAAYSILGLQSYLTAGPKEVRAWTIRAGATAPEAAGEIHSDFQKGFIAADVVSYANLLEAGSWAHARSLGQVRTEGKTYIMQPDDVVEFKFNVSS